MKLTPSQSEIMKYGLLDSGFNCILQMPTGSGKTWLAAKSIRNALSQGRRAIYVAPTRALALEIFDEWKTIFSHKVGIFTGDYGAKDNPYPVPFISAQIMVITPERLDACTRHWRSHWKWIPEIDLVIVDELHLLGDGYRGARLEGMLSRLLRLNPFIRVLGLSATLGNLDEISNWLNGVSYQSNLRPIPLTWRTTKFKTPQDKPNHLLNEVRATTNDGGQTLVFVQSRRRAEELDNYLKINGIQSWHHHGGLDSKKRKNVETAFRKGNIEVLIATPTLEVGVNLPTRKVVLYDLQYFNGNEFTPLSVNQVWQRAGRAGRPGFDNQGEVVLFSPVWDKTSKHYEKGKFEPILSKLNSDKALSEQVIAEVAAGLCRNENELTRSLNTTLAAHQERLPNINKIITTMCDAGMLIERSPENHPEKSLRLYATKLGRVAARQMLTPSTILLIHNVLKQDNQLSFLDLLILAACTEDCGPIIPVDFEELDGLVIALQYEPSQLLMHKQNELLELLQVDGRRFLSACKIALLLRGWTRQTDIDELANKHHCYGHEIFRLRESLLRLLTAMSCTVEDGEEVDNDIDSLSLKEKIKALHKMIDAGIDETQITLALISGIGPKIATKLINAGFQDIEDLAQAEIDELSELPGISSKRASEWISQAEKLMFSHTTNRFREYSTTQDIQTSHWPKHIDPYRLRRALDLQVSLIKQNVFHVIGGTDPHIVKIDSTTPICDCPDYSKGNTCKHILAVQYSSNNTQVRSLAKKLAEKTNSSFDLFTLWYSKNTMRKAS